MTHGARQLYTENMLHVTMVHDSYHLGSELNLHTPITRQGALNHPTTIQHNSSGSEYFEVVVTVIRDDKRASFKTIHQKPNNAHTR